MESLRKELDTFLARLFHLFLSYNMLFILLMQVETVDDYDEYCHYVAGLVGLGLSDLFHASGLEDLASDSLSNSMGLFLQVFF